MAGVGGPDDTVIEDSDRSGKGKPLDLALLVTLSFSAISASSKGLSLSYIIQVTASVTTGPPSTHPNTLPFLLTCGSLPVHWDIQV